MKRETQESFGSETNLFVKFFSIAVSRFSVFETVNWHFLPKKPTSFYLITD